MPFPNLPYFFDGPDFKLTESLAIHKYIADKWQPELLGRDVAERANVNMLAGVISEMQWAVRWPCYSSAEKEPIF